MTNNDVLRALRYALELDNGSLARFFAEAGQAMPLENLAAHLKDEDEPGFAALSDAKFARFLDGFIISQRGPRDPSQPAPPPPTRITNNHVLRCLKIALELKDVDMIAIMDEAEVPISKAELSALFRREDHRNFQPCGDQFLRNFLRGLGLWHRSGRQRQ
ncbi:MAG: DUF1456 family protein [Myxococcales bacterium]